VAKRSVKKARQRPEPAAETAPGRRPFWLGVLVAAVVLVPLAVVAVIVASGSGEEPQQTEEQAFAEEVESEAAELRRQTQVRDKEQVAELTERMRATVDALAPVLSGMGRTLPPGEDDEVGPLARAAAVQRWRRALKTENEYFADTVSGETGTNVARGGFAASLDALSEAVETYGLAVEQPVARRALLERARQQRDLAVRSWSVAATQLDAVNIATGYGHQHVYLGGSEAAGGFGADPAPEGSGAEGGE
jgi:cytoskeletal protein RodZ